MQQTACVFFRVTGGDTKPLQCSGLVVKKGQALEYKIGCSAMQVSKGARSVCTIVKAA